MGKCWHHQDHMAGYPIHRSVFLVIFSLIHISRLQSHGQLRHPWCHRLLVCDFPSAVRVLQCARILPPKILGLHRKQSWGELDQLPEQRVHYWLRNVWSWPSWWECSSYLHFERPMLWWRKRESRGWPKPKRLRSWWRWHRYLAFKAKRKCRHGASGETTS